MSSRKPVFKDSFKEYFGNLIGDELNDFIKSCETPLKSSIRVNTIKIDRETLKKQLIEKGWILEDIPFYKDAFIIKERNASLGNTIEHFIGSYYVQEQSSMIPPIVLNPKAGEKVLDCCASPGSKTTQIAQLMNNEGVLVANDKGVNRISILRSNLQRCGVKNTILTNGVGQRFSKLGEVFDKVLVDAPCSGFGAIRKDWSIAKLFNTKSLGFLKRTQAELLENGFKCLKSGGTIVYSTCTLTTEENEELVNNFLSNHNNVKLEKIRLTGLEKCKGIGLDKVMRIWPHHVDMEGFFIAKMVKL